MAENSDEGNSTNTHKRTFSTGPGTDQKSVDDKVDDPSANVDVSPPTKKTKLEGDDDAASTPDDGDELIPLTSQGPNVFYGYSDALSDLFEYGEEQGPYWLKSMVMDRYKVSQADQDSDDAETLTYAGITSDSKNLQTPEAKLLSKHFEGLSDDWWYEVTVKRQKPEGMRLLVNLESSKFDQEGYVWGGKDLGEWWISDIQAAEGESQKAIKTVHEAMF